MIEALNSHDGNLIFPERPKVGLTSDDGPYKGSIEEILGVLNDKGVTSTLFWILNNAKEFKRDDPEWFNDVLYNVFDNGHEIGYHGPSDFLPSLKSRTLTQFGPRHLRRGLWELEDLTGMNIKYFRPHTLFQPIAVAAARMIGLRTPIPDPVNYADGDAPVGLQIEKFSGGKEGSILVFHDGISLNRPYTNAHLALPAVIDNLRLKGLEPTKISELPVDSYRAL